MANILVIDDDHAVLATIELVLARDAHTVVVTDDGRKGLEMFKTGAFDLLIVDIFMPAMDGLQTMGLARRYRPEVPVLVISGDGLRSGPDFLRMATKLGAVSSLRKPFRPNDLLTAVDNCLAGPTGLPRQRAATANNFSTD